MDNFRHADKLKLYLTLTFLIISSHFGHFRHSFCRVDHSNLILIKHFTSVENFNNFRYGMYVLDSHS